MRLKTLCFAAVLASASLPAFAAPISALYVFGDSLSDNGNLSAAVFQNFGLVVPVAPYAPGRATNGPVAAEVLAAGLGLAPLIPVAGGGTNYAVIGAATAEVPFPIPGAPANTADNVAEAQGLILPVPTGILNAQLPLFASMLTGPIDPDALFVVWGGPNDVFINPSPATALQAANNIGTAIEVLYGLGARRFLVPNMPNLGRAPGAGENAKALRRLTRAFNTELAGNLAILGALPSVQVTPFNTFALFKRMASNPGLFGLSNVTDACVTGNVLVVVAYCGATLDDEFLFWDGSHPTARGHEVLGLALTDAVQESVPEPGTITLAALALTGLALRRRRRAA